MISAGSAIVPTVAQPTAPTFTIISNGDDLGPALPVRSIVVDRAVDRIPTATLIIKDGDVAKQDFEVSSAGSFDPGTEIEIQLGYRGSNERVFIGEVVSQRIKIRAAESLLIVTCKDSTYKMTMKRQSRYFTDLTDSDAWEDIVSAAGLGIEAEKTTNVVPELTQHLSTDWDFIISRAQANGMVTLVKDGKLHIGKPALNTPPALTLSYGMNVVDFDADLDLRRAVPEVESYAWSVPEGETINEGASVAIGVSGKYDVPTLADAHGAVPFDQHHGGASEPAELASWSAATLRRSELSRVRATVTYQGSIAASVGDTIELAAFGDVFNGPTYVSGLRHELTPGNWATTAQLGLDPTRFTEQYAVSAPPAAGLLPAAAGLHIARVEQMDNDPVGEERILITLPATAPEGSGNWARLATGLAGNEAGLVFRPAVGDEVVVGFLQDDPRYPIILGALHGSRQPAPLPPTEDNDQTGYVSRGGHRLVFDDTEESITLETPTGDRLQLHGGNKELVIEDQNGNKITLSGDGIALESSRDLTLKASGEIKLEGTTVNISSSANGEFSASGNLALKGALVNIN